MALNKHQKSAQILFVIWTGVILYLLLSAGGQRSDPYLFTFEDKLVHFTLFFGWVMLLSLGWPTVSKILVITLILLLAGGTEYLQQFVPKRSADIWDFVADTVGGVVGLGMSFLIKRD